MTVCYNAEVLTARPFGFVRLLFRWRGSFYKLIVHQFVMYFLLYSTLTAIYGFVLNDEQRHTFEQVGLKLGQMSGYGVSSVTLCLSFFMQKVYYRFWENFQQVPWPDSLAFYITAYVEGNDKRGRLLRRTMIRYTVASIVLGLMAVSRRMRIMFPNLDCLLVAGFLTSTEVNILKNSVSNGWQLIPLAWCAALVKRARLVENRIEDDFGYNAIIDELDRVRFRSRRLIRYMTFPFPLAYIHTVVLAVYSFFTLAAVAGEHRSDTDDLYDSVVVHSTVGDLWKIRCLSEAVTLLQFAICAGMLAATESLICPFGTNDGDIETDTIVKRHLGISYMIVDDMHELIPELSPDEELNERFYNVGFPPINPAAVYEPSSLYGEEARRRKKYKPSSEHLRLLVKNHNQVPSSTPKSENKISRAPAPHSNSRPASRQSSSNSKEGMDDQQGLEFLEKLSLRDYEDGVIIPLRQRIKQRLVSWLHQVPGVNLIIRRRSRQTKQQEVRAIHEVHSVMRLLSFRRMH